MYIDGRIGGETPLTRPAIAAGVHHVRVVRLTPPFTIQTAQTVPLTAGSLTVDLQKTNPLSGGNNRVKPWSFVGQLNGNDITGVLTTGDINQNANGVVGARGTSAIPITLR